MTKKIRTDKGVAGLTVLLSLIVMLFIIGLLVMIFAIMGSNLNTASYSKLTASSYVNESAVPTTGGVYLSAYNLRDGACGTITAVYNSTHAVINSANYTQTGCLLANKTGFYGTGNTWKVSYPFTYSADNSATNVMNDTVNGLTGVTDWFAIFITIGAMVVLILLVVIIIISIRGTGMMEGGNGGARNVGFA